MKLGPAQFAILHTLVFREDYPHKPPPEMPNGDGKVDTKEYRHIALKYLKGFGNAVERMTLLEALFHAHGEAELAADALNVPKEFRPDIRYGALRILRYPVGGFSHPHLDFDLFTLPLYRSQPDKLVVENQHMPLRVTNINPGIHIGELGEAIGIGKACRHEVKPSADREQFSAVYLAIPDWDSGFSQIGPDGAEYVVTVKAWLNERMARSRTEFKPYA